MPDMRALLIEQWRDRSDAALASIEACLRVSRATNRSALESLQGLLDDGMLERTQRGLVLTALGREMLASMRLLDGAPDVPPEPGDEIPAAWEAGARLALPVTSLTEEQVARILASVPDDGGDDPLPPGRRDAGPRGRMGGLG